MAIKETNTIFGAIKQYHEEIVKPKVKEITDKEAIDTNEIIKNYTEADTFLKEQFESQILHTEAALNSVDAQLREDLTNETSIRTAADYNLNVRIDEEALARIARDIELTNHVNAEISRLTAKTELELAAGLADEARTRNKEDLAIRNILANESALRIAEYNRMLSALEEEKTTRKENDDTNLQTLRNELEKAIGDEKDRIDDIVSDTKEELISTINDLDTKLTNSINNEVSVRKDTINKEIEDRINAIVEVKELIENETKRASSAEVTLATDLLTETTLREAAVKDLEDDINSEIVNLKAADDTLRTGLSAEISTRTSQFEALTKDINDAKLAAIDSANNTSNTNLKLVKDEITTTINSKVSELNGKIANLSTELTNEASTRSVKDAELDTRIATETENRIKAINDLTTQVAIDKADMKALVIQTGNNLNTETIARTQAILDLKTNLELVDEELQTQIYEVEARRLAGEKVITSTNQRIDEINLIVPAVATAANQLADKAYVEALVATETSVFIGTFDTLEEIMAIKDAKNNSYAFHKTAEGYSRYKFIAAEDE